MKLVSTICHQVTNELSNAYDIEFDHATDLDTLQQDRLSFQAVIENIKSSYDKANTVAEKIRLLTLLPCDWKYNKVFQHFRCSRYYFRKANELRERFGK